MGSQSSPATAAVISQSALGPRVKNTPPALRGFSPSVWTQERNVGSYSLCLPPKAKTLSSPTFFYRTPNSKWRHRMLPDPEPPVSRPSYLPVERGLSRAGPSRRDVRGVAGWRGGGAGLLQSAAAAATQKTTEGAAKVRAATVDKRVEGRVGIAQPVKGEENRAGNHRGPH